MEGLRLLLLLFLHGEMEVDVEVVGANLLEVIMEEEPPPESPTASQWVRQGNAGTTGDYIGGFS